MSSVPDAVHMIERWKEDPNTYAAQACTLARLAAHSRICTAA